MARTPIAASLAIAASLMLGQGSSAIAADPSHPTVVELFQSQGCSSCPPANANLNTIAGRPDVLALSFAVTYWDQLGWKDIFAQPGFTQRQWDYAKATGRTNVSTPQMIVNGRGILIGHDKRQVSAFLRRYDRGSTGPTIGVGGARVTIGKGVGRPATVWLVRYDPRLRNVPIRAGENGGRTLPHRNIVRSLQPLGQWRGAAMSFPVPRSPNPGYRSAVLVQQGRGGPIIAARGL